MRLVGFPYAMSVFYISQSNYSHERVNDIVIRCFSFPLFPLAGKNVCSWDREWMIEKEVVSGREAHLSWNISASGLD